MNDDLYQKLVDLYAGDELPQELKDELEAAALADKDLSHEMNSMRTTVDWLKASPEPEFTEESYQRILMRLMQHGVSPDPKAPVSPHVQYRLPMSG